MCSKESRKYVVTCEVYDGEKFIGMRDVNVEATHCSIAAMKAEMLLGHFAVDVKRL